MPKRVMNSKSILIASLLIILIVFSLTAGATYRPAVVGVNDLVTSANSLASQAGLQILIKGGNAIDAAVAVASTLNVVEAFMSGIDGVGFTSIYWATENKIYNISMTGGVPYAADFDQLTREELDK